VIAPHVLLGKGINLDNGCNFIETWPKMDEMKYDMCGAQSQCVRYHENICG